MGFLSTSISISVFSYGNSFPTLLAARWSQAQSVFTRYLEHSFHTRPEWHTSCEYPLHFHRAASVSYVPDAFYPLCVSRVPLSPILVHVVGNTLSMPSCLVICPINASVPLHSNWESETAHLTIRREWKFPAGWCVPSRRCVQSVLKL